MRDLLQSQIDAIDKAFRLEAASLSGKELDQRIEETNATLRTSWAIIRKCLKDENLIAEPA